MSNKKTILLYNIHPNQRLFKSSLSFSKKNFSVPNSDKLLISGSEMRKTQRNFKEKKKEKEEILLQNGEFHEEIQKNSLITQQNTEKSNEKADSNEKIIEKADFNEKIIEKVFSEKINENADSNEKIIEKADFNERIIEKAHFSEKINEKANSNEKIIEKADSNEKIIEKAHFSEKINAKAHFNDKNSEFYELKSQNFRNYKYKRYDKELAYLDFKSFGQNSSSKLPLIGSRWFPSIESILQQSSQEPKGNTFDKIRENYAIWKQNNKEKNIVITQNYHEDLKEKGEFSNENYMEKAEFSNENFKENRVISKENSYEKNHSFFTKTQNFRIKNQQKIYDKKPKTADCLLKTVHLNKISAFSSEKAPENSIHMNKDRLKRNFSRKFNEIYLEFQRFLALQRGNTDKLKIIGLRKTIEKIPEKPDKTEKILKKNEKFEEIVYFSVLMENADIFKPNNPKIISKILGIFVRKSRNSEGFDFNSFISFYEVFIEKEPFIDKITEFIIEFLRPKPEDSLSGFITNLKLLLINVRNLKKKQGFFNDFMKIFIKENAIEEKTLYFSKIPHILVNNMDIYHIFSFIYPENR